MGRKTERQEQLARRLERARRSDWEKLAAINAVVGDTKGAWQQRAEKALAVLHRHGLSKVRQTMSGVCAVFGGGGESR